MNLAEHLNRFYQDLKEPNLNRYPLALVKDWLDEAERVVNKKSKTIHTSEVTDSVNATRLYAKPTGLLDWQIKEIYYSETDSTKRKRLVPIDIPKLDSLDREWRTRTGTPIYWFWDKEQNKWGVQPYETTVRTGTNCIEILYRSLHTKMTRYYITGTVVINNGETAVAGTDTAFIGNTLILDELGIGKLLDRTTAFPTTWFALSATPVSDTVAAIAAFTLASVTGVNYIIASPSSIDNEELNLCSILWAMSLAMGKDKQYEGRNALQLESMGRLDAEMTRLEADADSEEAMVPEGAYPYPGSLEGDYH